VLATERCTRHKRVIINGQVFPCWTVGGLQPVTENAESTDLLPLPPNSCQAGACGELHRRQPPELGRKMDEGMNAALAVIEGSEPCLAGQPIETERGVRDFLDGLD